MRQLYYDKPAFRWKSALPLGNGFTAAMVYGGKKKEKISFNDCTLWSGYPKEYDSPESRTYLDKVRELVFAGKYKEATKMAEEKLTGGYSESFLPLGDLELKLSGGFGGYGRALDLDHAILKIKQGELRRECFASNPKRVFVYQIKGNRFSAAIRAYSKLKSSVTVDAGLALCGNAPDYVAPNYLHGERHPIVYEKDGKGMAFALFVRPFTDGRVIYKQDRILIKDASTLTLVASTATGFCGYNQMPSADRNIALEKAKKVVFDAGSDYEKLKKEHIRDYRSLYCKQDFSLHTRSFGNTEELLKNQSAFPQIAELLYHYGKYLMISGSRPGGQPLNLQGQWNKSIRPAWSSNYTVNINTQMNYWCASACGLEACLEPYFRMVQEVSQHGRKTAEVNYGCGGFACNHNVDIWRKTAPVKGSSEYMFSPLCGAWLANEVYEHYKNGEMKEESGQVKRIVHEAARFVMEYLVEWEGAYVVCPSGSPEAVFEHNGRCALGYHSAFENGLVRQALANAIELSESGEERKKMQTILDRVKPYEFGEDGLSEWNDHLPIIEKGHRHFSPLYGLYPGRVVGYYSDPECTAQMRKLFDCRQQNSKGQIGWSTAWAICLTGRFHDGESAQKNMQLLMEKALFKNLFNAHFPSIFQIDGNFGFVAGVNECLIGCENGAVELLPALPPLWREGTLTGIRVQGAAISFEWKNGEVVRVSSDRAIVLRKSHLANGCKIGKNIELKEVSV